MKHLTASLAVAAGLTLNALPTAAQDPAALQAKIDELTEELEELRRRDQAKTRALLQLERRLRALESGTQQPQLAQPAPPLAPPAPDTTETADATPSETELAQAEPVKKSADPARSIEGLVESEYGLFAGGRFTIEPGFSYSAFDRAAINLLGFLALDAIFLGTISVDQVRSDIFNVDMTGRFGVTDRLQIDATAPFVYRISNFQSGGAGGSSVALIEDTIDDSNLGDVTFGVNYEFFRERRVWPGVAVRIRGTAPTGTSPFGIETREVEGSDGNLIVPLELPTGAGVWGVSGGLSFLKTVNPAVIFANLTYLHRFQENFPDISAADGNQPGDVDLGDAVELGLGTAFALSENFSLSSSYSHRFVFETETRLASQPNFVSIPGSDANIGILNFGLTWAPSERLTIIGNVGAGLTEDASDVQLSLRFPVRF